MKTSAAVAVCAAAGAVAAYNFVARPLYLRWGTTCEERAVSWPGDEMTARARVMSMRAITIDARPADVWPWLMQIGQDRAGFYGYRPSVERVVPEFQHRFIGDTVWLAEPHAYAGKGKLVVGYLQANRAMILISPGDWERQVEGKPLAGITWGFILEPAPGGKTRLIMRSVSPGGLLASALSYFWELPHFVMEQRMMRHLKALIERSLESRSTTEVLHTRAKTRRSMQL